MAKTALDGTRTDAYYLDADKLHVATEKGHVLFNERNLLPIPEEFIASIEELGQIVPVNVMKDSNGEMWVTDGNRRVRAIWAINERRAAAGKPLMRVKALYDRGSDKYHQARALTANCQRFDSPQMIKAREAQRYMDQTGSNAAEAARYMNTTEASVSRWLSLLELSGAVQEAVDQGQISGNAALTLKDLSHAEQVKALDGMLGGEVRPSGATRTKTLRTPRSPNKTKIKALADLLSGDAQLVLRWATGDLSLEDLKGQLADFPEGFE